MQAKIELNPCPFCGGKYFEREGGNFGEDIQFRCLDCGALGPTSKDVELAALYWNAGTHVATWTETLPDKPGFYFYRNKKGKVSVVQLIPYETSYRDGFVEAGLLCDGVDHKSMRGEWCGPIPEPLPK